MLSSNMNLVFFRLSILTVCLCGMLTEVSTYDNCGQDYLKCTGGNCVIRSKRCNGVNYDCGSYKYRDNSDEEYCNGKYSSCPAYATHLCADRRRCIPVKWVCDRVIDCIDGSDEKSCPAVWQKDLIRAGENAIRYILKQRDDTQKTKKWGFEVARTAVSLYLADSKFFLASNATGQEIAYELSIQLLADLIRSKERILTESEIAVYLNALTVSCIDPRNFYGIDIVAMLRKRFNENVNSTNPYVLLSLCKAGDKMTHYDVDRLISLKKDPSRPVWTEYKALTLMALTCINNSKTCDFKVSPKVIHELVTDIADKQFRNGSVENLATTGLVIQALNSTRRKVDDFSMDNAIRYLINSQSPDSSFGTFLNTYYILPVLFSKSFLDIDSSRCNFTSKEDEIAAINDLRDKIGRKIYVKLTLWIGNRVDVARTLQLYVVANNSLFDLMDQAAEVDPMYRFEYTMLNKKPYVTMISKIQDDPASNKFWFLYRYNTTELIPLVSSPVDVTPENKEEYVLWYRSKDWNKELPILTV